MILDKIHSDGVASLDDLMQLLATSESTVRRDLEELASQGLLRRVHGGAEKPKLLQEELSNQQKSVKNVQAKKCLAQAAASLIADEEVIFIDAGTTTSLLIKELGQKNLTVVTNSIQHANDLAAKGIETIMIGGFVKQATNANIGLIAVEQINQLNFDKAFLGINGIDANSITTPDMAEAMVKKAIIKNAKETYILADSSKLDQVYFVTVAAVEEVTIISNQTEQSLIALLREKTKVITI
ncbi:DeoR/GlpR family DNA-binding transcription regulator [Streptococcus cuniculipharyngis]|uniref:DeoR/GlpR family DNA-binding transcription regulator n=1 Tax=Streptococcus cuniculipharyngis TaxID=1562651 RepID=UPI001FE8D2BA|nr:DeoR/GlpR family DNA-binding transcription regulator [Streptococcus cuniculipharyngis]